METPAAVYAASPRRFPAKLPEVEYPETMRVFTVRDKGHFRWKKNQEVFVSQVLWGEKIGLLPVDEHLYTVYFGQVPLARFDSRRACLTPLPKAESFYRAGAGEGEASPSPAPLPLNLKEKVSGMCPV